MNKPRRTQEARRQETRRNLIDATISVINEKGYAAMRTVDITKKAAVTWGAAQHLFGSRGELMTQVASNVSESLIDMLENDIDPHATVTEKIELIVDNIWCLYSSKSYFAMVEIVRGTRRDPSIHDAMVEAQFRITRRIEKQWLRLFSNTSASEKKILRVCNLVILFLSGLAARNIYLTPTSETENNISHIKALSVKELNEPTE